MVSGKTEWIKAVTETGPMKGIEKKRVLNLRETPGTEERKAMVAGKTETTVPGTKSPGIETGTGTKAGTKRTKGVRRGTVRREIGGEIGPRTYHGVTREGIRIRSISITLAQAATEVHPSMESRVGKVSDYA